MSKKNLFDTSKLQDVQWGNIELPGLPDDKLHSTNWNMVEGLASRSNNKEWRTKVKNSALARKNDPAWLEKVAERNKKQASDPAWLESVREGIAKRSEDPTFLEKQRAGALKASKSEHTQQLKTKSSQERRKDKAWVESFNDRLKERTNSSEWREKNAQGIANKNKSIHTPYGIFGNRKITAEKLGITIQTVSYRIKTQPDKYYYI